MRVVGATHGERSLITGQLQAQTLAVPGGDMEGPTLENPNSAALVSLRRRWAYRSSFLTAEGAGGPWTPSPCCRQVRCSGERYTLP